MRWCIGKDDGFVDTLRGWFKLETVYNMVTPEDLLCKIRGSQEYPRSYRYWWALDNQNKLLDSYAFILAASPFLNQTP